MVVYTVRTSLASNIVKIKDQTLSINCYYVLLLEYSVTVDIKIKKNVLIKLKLTAIA